MTVPGKRDKRRKRTRREDRIKLAQLDARVREIADAVRALMHVNSDAQTGEHAPRAQ